MRVDRVNLSLPSAHAARSESIARLVARGLAAGRPQRSGHLARVDAPPVDVGADWSAARVASAIVRSIQQGLELQGGSR